MSKLTTRIATEQDKPAIIHLMKQSLGESMIPKSEQLWNWKHEQNPLGKSFVLVAEESGELIGVRAFMQWKWHWKDQVYQAIRAVDTATHPAHQGKGIFKKLTLQQLEACKAAGIHFVFNTPNSQSKPGYLKMGWIEQGRMPLKIKMMNLPALIQAKLFSGQQTETYQDPTPAVEWKPALQVIEQVYNGGGLYDVLHTPLSATYIQWRYAINPLFNYTYFTDSENFLMIGRIKLQGKFREFRITECIGKSSPASSSVKTASQMIRQFCRQHQVHFISVSGNQFQHPACKPWLGFMGMIPVKPLGPVVTLRDLNMHEKFSELSNTANWGYSLGDMELF